MTAMPIAASLLPELDHEMQTTRALLERVPDSAADWKPHPRSMSMSRLAIHLPQLVMWISGVVNEPDLDITSPAAAKYQVPWEGTAALLAKFDRELAAGKADLARATDEALKQPWSLRAGDHVILTMPRITVLRTMVMNHVIHHRGQLSVYLRMNDVPLPDIYGPTADSAR